MGILTLQQDARYVISSDRHSTDAPVNRPPKAKLAGDYEVWTGAGWSSVKSEAMTFDSLDDADEFVKANYARLSGK